MRIDGDMKASGGQQAQSRFEQVMARELSKSSGGKSPSGSNVRADLSAMSKRKAPSSERVGTDFKSSQAGKILKGLQNAARQTLSKTMAGAGEAAKGPFAGFVAGAKGAMSGAGSLATRIVAEGIAKAGVGGSAPGEGGGAGRSAGSESAASTSSPSTPATPAAKDGGSATLSPGGERTDTARGDGPRTGGPAGAQVAATTTGAGADRMAPAATPAEASAPGTTATSLTTGAETPGVQDGRAVPAVQTPPVHAETVVLLQNPWLQSAAGKAAANGAELDMVLQLGPNIHGAEFVSIATDDTGYVTGPEIEISLTDGALDTDGNWVAQRGEGMLKGVQVTLEPDADGCAFVSEGGPDDPDHVRADIAGAEPLRADVVAVRKLR